MPKGKPNKRYTGEFKQMVVETMRKDRISYDLLSVDPRRVPYGKLSFSSTGTCLNHISAVFTFRIYGVFIILYENLKNLLALRTFDFLNGNSFPGITTAGHATYLLHNVLLAYYTFTVNMAR